MRFAVSRVGVCCWVGLPVFEVGVGLIFRVCRLGDWVCSVIGWFALSPGNRLLLWVPFSEKPFFGDLSVCSCACLSQSESELPLVNALSEPCW